MGDANSNIDFSTSRRESLSIKRYFSHRHKDYVQAYLFLNLDTSLPTYMSPKSRRFSEQQL